MTRHSKDGNLYSDNTSGRIFLPEEIAETAAFLLSDYSSCVSGEIIHTNGGNHIKMGW
jgi:3-oxoacyl-[acyl-carrier protein] reductase